METQPAENKRSLWTADELARHLRCSKRHLDNLRREGLPCLQVGRLVRFDPEAVRRFLEGRTNTDGGLRHG